MRRKITLLLAALGMAVFVLVFIRMEPAVIWQTITRISWTQFLLLVFMRLIFWLLRSFNWRLVLLRCDARVSLLQLLRARLAGHAVGFLTPTSKIGGEAFKVLMVPVVPKRKIIAAAIVDKTIELQATMSLIIVAVVVTLMRISVPATVRVILVGFTMVALLLTTWLHRQQKKGLFAGIVNLLRKVRLNMAYINRKQPEMELADQTMSSFYSLHRRTHRLVLLLYTALVLWWSLEIFLNLRFIGAREVSPLHGFLLVTLGTVVNLLPGLPGAIGIYEVTYLSLFALLGIPLSVGIALILFRRLLALLWAGIGLTVMAIRKKQRSAWE